MKLIDIDEGIEKICKRCKLLTEEDEEPCTEECNWIKILKKMPEAQPERKKGKWISFCCGKICNCSVCYKGYDNTYEFIEEWNYCPNCGAKMER